MLAEPTASIFSYNARQRTGLWLSLGVAAAWHRCLRARRSRRGRKLLAKVIKSEEGASDGGVRFLIKHDKDGNPYWYIETAQDIFKDIQDVEEIRDAAYNYILQSRNMNTVLHAIDGKKVKFIRLSAEEFTRGGLSESLLKDNPEMFKQKMRMIPSLEDILLNARANWKSPDHKEHKLFKERGFENFRGKVRIDNVIFNYVVRAGKAKFGDVFYDINLEVASYLPHANGTSDIYGNLYDNRIAQNNSAVNSNNMQKSKKDASGEERELADDGVETVEGTVVKSSYSSWTPAEKARVEKALAKAGFEEKVARKWIADVDLVAAVIKSEEVGESGGVRYELNPNFAVAYDNWINKYGRRDDMSLLVGRTSAALQSIGIKEHSIYWPTQKINTSLADHQELTDDIMKQIPDILENPIIVLESNSVEAELENPESNRIVMFGEVYGEDDMPIMAVLELEPKNRKGLVMDQIRLISTYTKDGEHKNITATQNIINDSYILYIEPQKNRTNAWLRRNRLQLPFGVTKYGPINKVSYRSDFVNSDFMQKQKKDAKSTKKTSAATALEKFLEKNPDFKFADEKEKQTKVSYSYAEDNATKDAPKMPNGENVPTSNDVRISPLASAEKMLRGGMPWSEVQKRTKLTMRQIALQMWIHKSFGKPQDDKPRLRQQLLLVILS